MSLCLSTVDLRQNGLLIPTTAGHVRRFLSALASRILAQRRGLCEAWGLQDNLERLCEALHCSLIRSEQPRGTHRRSQSNPQCLATIEAASIVQCAIQIWQHSIEG